MRQNAKWDPTRRPKNLPCRNLKTIGATTTSFLGSSLYLQKVPWLRLVTCLLDFRRFQRSDWREGLESWSLSRSELDTFDMAVQSTGRRGVPFEWIDKKKRLISMNALLRKFFRPKELICESAYIHFRQSTALEPIRSCEPPLFSNILTADYCDRSLRLDEVKRNISEKQSFLNEARSA